MTKIPLSEPHAIDDLAANTSNPEIVATKIRIRLYRKYPKLSLQEKGQEFELRSTRLAFLKEHEVEVHCQGKLLRITGKDGEIGRIVLDQELSGPMPGEGCL